MVFVGLKGEMAGAGVVGGFVGSRFGLFVVN